MDDYKLNDEERAGWRRLCKAHFPHGSQRRAGKALAEACGKEESTLTRYLNEFIRGDETPLRFFLASSAEDQTPVALLEEHLGLPLETFRGYLNQVRNAPGSDGPFDLRLAGFADQGPVPIDDAWLPPPTRGFFVGHERFGAGGTVELDALVSAVLEDRGRRTVCMITGPRGAGRSTLLRRLVHEIAPNGGVVWEGGEHLSGARIAAIDDYSLRSAEEKRALARWAAGQGPGEVLVIVVEPEPTFSRLRPADVVIELARPGAAWLADWVGHLQNLVRDRWGRPIDGRWLTDWLLDEPTAVDVVGRPDIAGMLLRVGSEAALEEGGPTRALVLAAVRRHTAELLETRGAMASAAFVRMHGHALLARLGVAAWRSDRWTIPERGFGPAAWDAMASTLGIPEAARLAGESEGFAQLLADLVEVGVLRRVGAELEISPRGVVPLAFGAGVCEGLVGLSEALEATLLRPEWHAAIELLAEEPTLADGVLDAVLSLPDATLSQAVPALTRALAARLAARDAALVNQAFRLCAAWWARAGAAPPTVTLEVRGTPSASRVLTAHEGRIAGCHPLVLLGKASVRLADRLEPLSAEALQQGRDLSPGLHAVLDALGSGRLEEIAARRAALVAAPALVDEHRLLSPEVHEAVAPGVSPPGDRLALTADDYDTWWRGALLPAFEAVDSSTRLLVLAGVAEGFDIRWWMGGQWRRADAWARALTGVVRSHPEEAIGSVASAFGFTARRGGPANRDSCQAVWRSLNSQGSGGGAGSRANSAVGPLGQGVRRRTRLQIAQAVRDDLGRARGPELIDDRFLAFLLSEVVDAAARRELWEAIAAADASRMPWRAFRAAGLPLDALLGWALEPVEPEATLEEQAEAILRSGRGGAIELTPDGRTRRALLEHYLDPPAEDCPPPEELLAALRLIILNGTGPLRKRAIEALQLRHEDAARPVRRELALALGPPHSFALMPASSPEPGEAGFWAELADRTEAEMGLAEITLSARADLAAVVDGAGGAGLDLWPRTFRWLVLADLTLMTPDERAETLRDEIKQGLDTSALEVPPEHQAKLLRKTSSLLGQLVLVTSGKHDPHPGARQLALRIVNSPRLLPLIQPGTASGRLLRWAADEAGSDALADYLANAALEQEPATVRTLMLAAMEHGGDALVLALAEHLNLREPISLVMEPGLPFQRLHLLRSTLEVFGFSKAPTVAETPSGRLFGRWLDWHPGEALAALRQQTAAHPPESRAAWWTFALRSAPPGKIRASAADALLRLHRE